MATATWSFRSCDSSTRARGLCNKHYLRAWNDGTLDLVAPDLPTPETRFWAKVDKGGPGGCWLWIAYIAPEGYGRFVTRDNRFRSTLAYRVAYELTVGAVPEGLQLDHTCRVRACVNPAHLEPVTPLENNRRMMAAQMTATHCSNRHEYTAENTERTPNGRRRCVTCQRNTVFRYRARRRAATRSA